MLHTTFLERRRLESLSAADLAEHQRRRLNALLKAVLPRNRFYAEKLAPQFDFDRLADDGRAAPLARRIGRLALHLQGRIAAGRRHGALGLEPDVSAQRLSPLSSDLGDARPADGGARYGRGLAMVARMLAICVRCRRHPARRLLLDGVFVRPVRRLLECLRGGDCPRLPGGADRRSDDAGPAGNVAFGAGDRRLFDAQLCPAHGRSRCARIRSTCAQLGLQAIGAGRRAGGFDSARPGQDRPAVECRGARSRRRNRSRAVGLWRCQRPRDVRDGKRIHCRVPFVGNRCRGRRGGAFRTGADEFGPDRLSGHSLPHRRPGAAGLAARRQRIGSCCSKGASSAASTTCWWCGE